MLVFSYYKRDGYHSALTFGLLCSPNSYMGHNVLSTRLIVNKRLLKCDLLYLNRILVRYCCHRLSGTATRSRHLLTSISSAVLNVRYCVTPCRGSAEVDQILGRLAPQCKDLTTSYKVKITPLATY